MKKTALFLLSVLAVPVFAGDVLVVEPMGGSQHGAWVGVDVMEAVHAVRELATQEKDVYVETLNRPKAGELYADAAEGVIDAQTVSKTETKQDVGIFEAVGTSISRNPWAWAVGAATALAGAYAVYDHNSGSKDSTPPPPTYNFQDIDGDITIIDGDGNSQTETNTNQAE